MADTYVQMTLDDIPGTNERPGIASRPRQPHAGAFRRKEAICEAVKNALANCKLTREEVAAELSRLTGDEICIHTVNNWAAPSKQSRRFPLEYAEALVVVTGDTRILQAAIRGFIFLGPEDASYYELGRIIAEERERSKRKRQIFERIKT